MRAMTERLSSDADLATALPSRARGLPRRAAAARRRAGDRRRLAGGMPDRVKCLHVLVAHALAAGPGVNPLGDEALALLLPDWWADRSAACDGAGDARRRHRLRHQLDPAAGRRHRPGAGDAASTSTARMEIVRLGQGVDRTGRLAPEALERTFAACRRLRRADRASSAPSGCASWRPRPPATPRTATSSSPASASGSASSPRS